MDEDDVALVTSRSQMLSFVVAFFVRSGPSAKSELMRRFLVPSTSAWVSGQLQRQMVPYWTSHLSILLATSMPVTFSNPRKPGALLTSSKTG